MFVYARVCVNCQGGRESESSWRQARPVPSSLYPFLPRNLCSTKDLGSFALKSPHFPLPSLLAKGKLLSVNLSALSPLVTLLVTIPPPQPHQTTAHPQTASPNVPVCRSLPVRCKAGNLGTRNFPHCTAGVGLAWQRKGRARESRLEGEPPSP